MIFRLVDSRNTDGEKNVYIYENETGERREYAEDDPLMMRSGTIGRAPFKWFARNCAQFLYADAGLSLKCEKHGFEHRAGR